VVAKDGEEALNYLYGAGRYGAVIWALKPCVIRLYLKMPRIEGLEVLQKIRADERTKFHRVVVSRLQERIKT